MFIPPEAPFLGFMAEEERKHKIDRFVQELQIYNAIDDWDLQYAIANRVGVDIGSLTPAEKTYISNRAQVEIY